MDVATYLGARAFARGASRLAGATDVSAGRIRDLGLRTARAVAAAWRNQTRSTTSSATTTTTLHRGRTEKAASVETTTTSDNDTKSDRPRTRRADGPRLASEARAW